MGATLRQGVSDLVEWIRVCGMFIFIFIFPLGRYLSTGDLTKVYIDCTMFIGTISSAEPVGCFRPRGDRQGYAALQYCWRQIAGRCQSYGKSDTSSGPALPESSVYHVHIMHPFISC